MGFAGSLRTVHAHVTRTQHKHRRPKPFTVFNCQPVQKIAAPLSVVPTPVREFPTLLRVFHTLLRTFEPFEQRTQYLSYKSLFESYGHKRLRMLKIF